MCSKVGGRVERADGVKGTVMDSAPVSARRGGGVELLIRWDDGSTGTVIER